MGRKIFLKMGVTRKAIAGISKNKGLQRRQWK